MAMNFAMKNPQDLQLLIINSMTLDFIFAKKNMFIELSSIFEQLIKSHSFPTVCVIYALSHVR